MTTQQQSKVLHLIRTQLRKFDRKTRQRILRGSLKKSLENDTAGIRWLLGEFGDFLDLEANRLITKTTNKKKL